MKISMIYMASGSGKRFGANKLLVPFGDKPLYLHGLEQLARAARELESADGFKVQVLAASRYEAILSRAREMGIKAFLNTESSEGIAASLRLGILQSAEDTDIYMFSVADQPYLASNTITCFLREFAAQKRGIGCVCSHGKKGNPAAFVRSYRGELLAIKGDRGGRTLMQVHPDDVWTMEVPGEQLRDIDLPGDLPGPT